MGSRRNTKKLSLILPCSPRPTPVALLRRDEDGSSPSLPYTDGPVQVIPGLWIGSEDNARDWVGLRRRRIGAILNVAKEVSSPFDPLRSTASVSNLNSPSQPTYYPPHIPTGRPPMHYLNLQWSHGQKDLVNDGFQAGMAFADAAFARGDGVLVQSVPFSISFLPLSCPSKLSVWYFSFRYHGHRPCHARSSPPLSLCPPRSLGLGGYARCLLLRQGQKQMDWSEHVVRTLYFLSSPLDVIHSLIYELLDYEKVLKSSSCSLTSGQEGEWSRKRQSLDHIPPEQDTVIMQEARALDKAMEDRVVARKSSASSLASTTSMGSPWQNRFHPRKRAGSIASNMTSNSIVSEHLVEEDEEPELLGIGGGFDSERERRQSADTLESSATNSPDDDIEATPRSIAHASTSRPFSHLHIPPSAPAWKNSFDIIPPPPRTAARSTFDLPPRFKSKYRPSPIRLSPVPPSPVAAVVTAQEVNSPPVPVSTYQTGLLHSPSQSLPTTTQIPPRLPFSMSLPKSNLRQRTEPPRPAPSIHFRKRAAPVSLLLATPQQTLFVFPPSPTLTTRTPSAAMLTMTAPGSVAKSGMVPFPSVSTPKISTFRQQGRTKSFIGIGTPMVPTTVFTKVEARGYVGLE